jgi:hypothetical protein
MFVISLSVGPWQVFQTSLLFVFSFFTNFSLGWKGLPRINTPAYYENLYITDVKNYVALGLINLFTVVIYKFLE